MKQKLLLSAVIMIATFLSSTAMSQEVDFYAEAPTGQTLQFTVSSGTVTCTGYRDTCIGALSIPDSVTFNGTTYPVRTLSKLAFKNCKGITSLIIPRTVTSIGDEAFRGCGNLTSIVVESGNSVYDSRNNCNAIIKTSTNSLRFGCCNTSFPSTVTSIHDYAFNWCENLTSITIPSTITNMGRNPFRGCKRLTSITVESGNSVYDSRNNCNAIVKTATNDLVTGCKNTVIPNTVTTIGVCAFENCGISGNIAIPNTITRIKDYAFKDCSDLTDTLVLPSSLTAVNSEAFKRCVGLPAIKSLATVPPTLDSTAFEGITTVIPVGVPCGSVATYRATARWDSFSNIHGLYDNQTIEAVASCDSYTWHGRTFTSSTDTATYTTTNAAGCDSVVTLNLTVNYRNDTAYTQVACDSFTWSTTTYDVTAPPTGAINSQFSVGENSQVYISQGNLQYQASTGTWRFAPNQWDCISFANSNISSTYSGWIDLFGWGTSGWNSGNVYYQPYSSASEYASNYGAQYGPVGSYSLTGTYANADWGVNNAISNGGNAAGLWRTLTIEEWQYLFNSRAGASGKWGQATVNSVNGLILLPDSFTDPMKNGGSGAFSASHSNWSDNNYSGDNWTAMQTAGAVFLPASGYRKGTTINNCGFIGYYWSSSSHSNASGYAYGVIIYASNLDAENYCIRLDGRHVRLVRGYNSNETSDTYNSTGTYYHSYTAANGCPSVDTLHLTIHSSTAYTDVQTACDNLTWIDGVTYTASNSTAKDTLVNAAGCDSVVTLHLTINHCSTTVTTACDSLVWNGTTYRTDGTYKHGTDTLILTINHSTTGTETVTACNQYTWHGRTFTASTDTAMYTTTNAAGCDSVVTLHLTINHCSTTEIAACGNLRWHNTTYSASGTYTDGNDTLILTINHSTSGSETVAACNSYEWHGRTFTASVDTAKYTTTNAAGCDSVVTLNLTINHDSSRVFTAEALNSYTWVIRNNSHTYTQSGTYIDRYTTVHGCSGTDTLHLTITASERYYNVRVASNNSSWGRAYLVSDSRVQQGRQGVVRVTPNRGYRFSHWSDGSTASPYAFTVTQDTLLVAYFEPATFTVTLNNANPGCGIVSGSGSANYGSRHNIAAAPNYGYRFSRWDDGDTNAHRTITVTNNVTLTAYFGVRQFNVSALPANYAQGTVTGGGSYDYRSMVTLAATPNGGYEFDHWSDGETLNPRRITVTRDTVLTAVFRMVPVIPTHTVTVVSANPAMGSVIGGGTYDEGAVAAIAAIANSGCEFTGWTDGSTANPRMITVTGDTVFTATFREIYVPSSYTITVTSNDPELGRVSGSGTYDAGETVHLDAYPSAHVHFLRWSDGNTEANRSFAASGNLSLTAIFARDSIVITARANDDRMGHVVGGGAYPIGGEATLTAIPNYGYRFICWSHGETSSTITFTVRYADTYTALFESTTQGVDEAEGESIRVWSHGLTIHVAGLTGEPLKVYDVTGRLVAERTAAHGDMVIPVTHPGLYLVQTGTTTHKVLTR